MKLNICTIIIVMSFQPLVQPTQRKAGNPIDHLHDNMKLLATFGERADFSPDNNHKAFMAKSFGDAIVIDKTGTIKCITCNVPCAEFLRVRHFITVDYIIKGPDKFEDIITSRNRDNELWFLYKVPGSKRVKLGMKIVFSQVHAQAPNHTEEAFQINVIELELSGCTPKFINQKTLFESPDRSYSIEYQVLYADSKLIFACYEPDRMLSVMGLDLEIGEVTNYNPTPQTYKETEGIFLAGKYTLDVSDKQTEWPGGGRGP